MMNKCLMSYLCSKKILPLKYLFVFKVMTMFFNRSGNRIPNKHFYRNKLRNAEQFTLPKPKNTFFTKTYNFIAPRIFNRLPDGIKKSKSANIFINKLKKWLFSLEEILFLFLILK